MVHRMMLAARLFVILILLLAPTAAYARPALDFVSELSLTTGAANGAAAWADIDNDNDLDLVITGLGNGETAGQTGRSILLLNTGTSLAETTSGNPNNPAEKGFENVESSSADWADYNGDGYLDMLLTGQTGVTGIPPRPKAITSVYYSSSYTKDGATLRYFKDALVGLPGIYRGRGTWGDYDNDGRPDFLLTGYQPGYPADTPFTALYHNNGGTFSPAAVTLPALGDSYAAWGDYNRDGNLDFALMGKDASGAPYTAIYQNNGNSTFTAMPLTGQSLGQLAWADIDVDGDLDLLVSGSASSGTLSFADYRALSGRGAAASSSQALASLTPATHLYRDDNGAFVEVMNTGLPALSASAVAFGDYDNDGDPDLLLNGKAGYDYTDLWINDRTGRFTKASLKTPLKNGDNLSLAWGDFNLDGSLDALVTGTLNSSQFYETTVYLNQPAAGNTLPAPPSPVTGGQYMACWAPGATAASTNVRVVLRWNPPTNDSTPPAGITYNVRAGAAPGSADILRPAADLATGYNRLSAPGNGSYRPSGNGNTASGGITLSGLRGDTTYYWAVSSVDAAYAGGAFSAEQAFKPNGSLALTNGSVSGLEDTPLTINVLQNAPNSTSLIAVDPPAHGSAAVNGRQVVYTPALNYNGPDTLTYYAIDGGVCNMSTVSITVNNTPDPPTLFWKNATGQLQPGPAAIQTGLGTPVTFSLVGMDPDPGDKLTWSISGQPGHGTAAVATPPTASGVPVSIRYTPAARYAGSDTFTVHITDSDTPTVNSADIVVQVTIIRYSLYLPVIRRK